MKGRFWIAVASADHVSIGKQLGFMQVCHGKAAPLKRLSPHDHVIYYSPVQTFGKKDRLQCFTAFGIVREGHVFQAEMSPNFHPYRRNVDWMESRNIPIHALLNDLNFTHGEKNWGYKFRFGLFEIDQHDGIVIQSAMLGE
ncbi:EVE domain-containing protein [Brucellaceae bacterium C25G]